MIREKAVKWTNSDNSKTETADATSKTDGKEIIA